MLLLGHLVAECPLPPPTGPLAQLPLREESLIHEGDGPISDLNMLPPTHTQTHILARTSQDRVLNSSGRELIDLCTTTGLVILNGRTQGDLEGRFTFDSRTSWYTGTDISTGKSVVDYFMASQGLMTMTHKRSPGPHLQVSHNPAFGLASDHFPITLDTLSIQPMDPTPVPPVGWSMNPYIGTAEGRVTPK